MISAYIAAAMRRAHYEIMETGRFFGSIPECKGCWAEAATLEECREELQSAFEDWLILGLQLGHPLPVIDGLDLNSQEAVRAEASSSTRKAPGAGCKAPSPMPSALSAGRSAQSPPPPAQRAKRGVRSPGREGQCASRNAQGPQPKAQGPQLLAPSTKPNRETCERGQVRNPQPITNHRPLISDL